MYLQTHNQFLYFRMRDVYSNELYKACGQTEVNPTTWPDEDESIYDNVNFDWKFQDNINTNPGGEENILSSGWNLNLGTLSEILAGYRYDYINDLMNWKLDTDVSNIYKDYRDSQGVKYVPNELKYTSDNGNPTTSCMWMYPELKTSNGLLVNDNNANCILINPKDKIIIPIVVEFFVSEGGSIKKTMSFDIWPSLYKDPINYSFTIVAKFDNSVQDKLISQQQSDYKSTESKYNIIYK
jgi:hypothetical protein